MWKCIVLENGLTHGIDKMVFDFGYDITLVVDYDEKIIKKFHGKIKVCEYNLCPIEDINVLLKNISNEITIRKK